MITPRLSAFTKICVPIALLCGMISQHVQAQETGREARLQKWLKQFPEADTNRDGKLSEREAKAYRDNVLSKRRKSTSGTRLAPTHADVKYGPHERNVFDLWLPAANDSAGEGKYPLFVYFHGGGFVAGDKSGFDPSSFLADDMAVVSANYRFVDGSKTLSPAPLHDSARVIQFLRSKANDWNLDTDRIAVSGSSAGAVISMWIGYHDDLANPDSDDPVARQSSRVTCIAPLNGPSNLDPRWITETMGGPKHIHGSFPKMFGAAVTASDSDEVRDRILESSPIEHVSADDPPSLLIYTGKPAGIPLPESASTGVLIHHAYFGQALKQRLDKVGVANEYLPATDPRKDGYAVIRKWLSRHGFKP